MKMPLNLCLFIIIGILGTTILRADVVTQGFELFATTSVGSNPGTITNGNWVIHETHVVANNQLAGIVANSGTNFAILADSSFSGVSGTNSYVESPELINGVGSISFYLRNRASRPGPFVCEVRTSTNGVTWQMVQAITNMSESWTPHTVEINSYEPIRVRIFRGLDTANISWIYLDDISTTEVPAKVDIIDHAISPASPTADNAVTISAELDPSTLASDLVATLYWSANGGSSNTISMATNALSGGRYETVTPITNQPAFTVINYTVHVAFGGPTPLSPVTASGSFFLRQPPLASAYTNVTVEGGITQTLELFDDEYWIGVKDIASPGSYSLYFESVSSVTNQWRDPAQSRTTLPVFGAAVTNYGPDIQLDGTPAGWLMFSFDEGRSRYGIQQADVQNFNSSNWTGFSGSGIIEGWSVTNALASATAGLAYGGNSIQFADTADERSIASPELTNGVGTILFRYRNTVTNGLNPATFAIQTKANAGGAWQTVDTVENIITPDYINHRYSVDNLELRYVRISGTGPAAAQLLIDDIIVTRPGATVTSAGLTNSPSNPTILDEVDVSVDITTHNGAEINTNSPPTLWFGAGTNGVYDPIPMTSANGTNWTATIPRGARGTMQYYVETTYLDPATGGYSSANEPLDRTGSSAAYTNSDAALDAQGFETFATTSVGSNPGTITNGNWVIHETHVVANNQLAGIVANSGTNFAILADSSFSGVSGTNSYVESPELINGVGSISFYLRNRANRPGPFVCEVRTSTNGVTWQMVQAITNTSESWTPHTVEINSYEPIRVRIFRELDTANISWIYLDDISLTYPPAYVAASGFELHPAYPSQETNTTVACAIESATSYHQAFNITGTLMYRTRDNSFSSWTGWAPVSMYRGTGNRFYGDIPAQLNLTEVEYYVEAGFNGYSAAGEGKSPMEFPAPEAALGFTTRRYESAFEQLGIRIGTTDVASFNQLGNGQWEGVLTFVDATNNPAFTISGYGHYDGTNVQSGFYGTWGDNNPFRTNMPLAGVASLGESAIVIPEEALGQYIIRFDENSGDYSVQRAAYQDFENWKGGNEYFGESFAAAEMTEQEQNFDTWTPSEDDIDSNFEDAWDSVYDYPEDWIITESTDTGGTNIFFYIEQGIVVTQALGQAALLAPESERGYIRNDVPGAAGSLSFDLRAASPNDFRPAIHPGVTNTNIRIEAKIKSTDMPTNSTLNSYGFAYKSIIGNYVDTDNYYEARLLQISPTQIRYELWEINGGTATRRGTPQIVNSSITTDHTVQLNFYRLSTNSVKIRLTGSSKTINYDDTSAIPSAYAFGFSGMDASLSIDDVKIYSVTNSTFAINSTAVLTESFTNTPSGWDITSKWTVSDGRYTRPGYTGSPIEARVEFSPNLTFSPQTTVSILTNLTHSYYRSYTANVHTAISGYVRVRNFSGDGYLIIDNIKRTAWRGKAVSDNGWTGTNVWVETASESGRGIELRTSRALAAAEQSVTSPLLTNGVSLIAFDYLPANDATGAVAFVIDYRVSGENWTNITTKTDSSNPTNWVHYAFSVDDADLRKDIIYMRVRNITAGPDDGLRIDNLVITELIPINDTTWWGYNALVTDQKPAGIYDSDASPWRARIANNLYGAFLNNSSTNGTADGATNDVYYPFIRSARLPDGIGEIRFLYRAWDTNASEISIVAATNRELPYSGWVELATVSVTSTNYQEYISTDIFERNYHYLGLRVDSKNGSLGRVAIDNILIVAPFGADLELRNVRLEPAIPVAGDNVFIKVDVEDLFFSPTDIALSVLHRTGTSDWGNHSSSDSIEMEIDEDRGDSITYISKTPITQTVIDTVVQYQIEATFNGLNADRSSPKYFRGFENPAHYWPIDLNRDLPGTNTPYYIVFSCLPGQVWINELNIADDSIAYPTGQFIELAGWGQANIGDWRLEVIDTDFTTNAAYAFGSNFKIGSNPTNYNFYVFGHTNIVVRNRDLTNALPWSGGLQLVRQRGIIDQQISYDTFGEAGKAMVSPDNRFVYVGFDDDWEDYSISMIGSGSNLANFETNWVNTTAFSIGTTNFGQTLIPWPTNGSPVDPDAYTGTVTIVSAALSNASDRVYFTAYAEEAGLMPSVWYVTNLLNVTSNDWQLRTEDFGHSAAGTNYQIWCQQVTPPVFYRIGMSMP